MNIDKFIKHYDDNKVPTFKETLSMMTGLRNFAAQVDEYFMKKISVEEYVLFILKKKFVDDGKVVNPNSKKLKTYWDNVLVTYLGLCKAEFEEFKNSQLGVRLYNVTSNAELLELIF